MKLSENFVSSLSDCEGFSLLDFVAAHHEDVSVSVRVNNAKLNYASTSVDTALLSSDTGVLSNEKISGKVPWNSDAYYLLKRPLFTLDPAIHAGAYYVQEASSMFIGYAISQVLEGQTDLKALDLCASPGGKTTLLASMPHFRLVLANEIIQSRVPALYENVVKWGQQHVFISNNDPRDFEKLGGLFDVVLVDAPCSGSGLFRKDKEALNAWTPDLVNFCALRQRRIVKDALNTLSENGIMLYSTCSFSFEENESNLDFFLKEFDLESVQIKIPSSWGIVETKSPLSGAFCYRFYPDKVKGEGFFCSIVRKRSASSLPIPELKTNKNKDLRDFQIAQKWVNSNDPLHFFSHDKNVFAFDERNLLEVMLFQEYLNLRKSGVRIGVMMRQELIPDHELAMSNLYASDILKVEVNEEQALQYLRKENMKIEIEVKGWMMIAYKKIPLGWIKSLPGRINNYYPMNWRITMRG